jgi:hypothetical protein
MPDLDFDDDTAKILAASQLVAEVSQKMASLWARLEVLEATMPPVRPCSVPAITTTPPVFPCAVRRMIWWPPLQPSPTPSKSKMKESSCRRLFFATITAGQQFQAEHENLQHIGESTDAAPEKSWKILTREADLPGDVRVQHPPQSSASAATWGLVGDHGR